jgi:hypothetical protein
MQYTKAIGYCDPEVKVPTIHQIRRIDVNAGDSLTLAIGLPLTSITVLLPTILISQP